MNNIYPSIVNISSTIIMMLIYLYLYVLYSENYILVCLISWLIYFFRTIFFDSQVVWTQSTASFVAFQIMSISSALLFTHGTLNLVGRKMPKYWLYAAIGALALGTALDLLQYPLLFKMYPFILFCGLIYIFTGITLVRHPKLTEIGKITTGYACILWGIHSLDMPLLLSIDWIVPLGYSIGGLLRLTIALGVLLGKDYIRETQYRLLADNAVDVIYRYRILPEPKFEYISPSVFEITGYATEEYYANPKLFESLLHPDDLWVFKTYTKNASWPLDIPLDYRLIHKDKSIRYIEQNFIPRYDAEGNVIARQGVIRDVTVRHNIRQAETQDDRLNMIGKMAVSVAHEIRNPLTTVRGYLQIMRKKELHNKERFNLMIQELDKTSSVINEYLLLAEDKRSELERRCLNSIVTSLLPLIEVDTTKVNVRLKARLGTIPTLYLDEKEIRQLILNLVHNGLEAMSSGGELIISTFLKDDRVYLTIRDQGSGIPEQIINEIGTPFLTTKRYTGTGLGLPICYRIAHRHYAVIDFNTSKKGTEFLISFAQLDILPN